jgi:hypothetical protein
VISRLSVDSAVSEMGEYECGFDDVADLAGAGGEVPQGTPASDEDGEATRVHRAKAL